jgi:hypothetical protein
VASLPQQLLAVRSLKILTVRFSRSVLFHFLREHFMFLKSTILNYFRTAALPSSAHIYRLLIFKELYFFQLSPPRNKSFCLSPSAEKRDYEATSTPCQPLRFAFALTPLSTSASTSLACYLYFYCFTALFFLPLSLPAYCLSRREPNYSKLPFI